MVKRMPLRATSCYMEVQDPDQMLGPGLASLPVAPVASRCEP